MLSQTEALHRVRITAVATPRLEWAVGREVSLPVSLLTSLTGSSEVDALDLTKFQPIHSNGLASGLRLRAAFTRQPSVSRLPFSYQRVPAPIRWGIARTMGLRMRRREHEWAQFPGWPLDLSADFVEDWSAADSELPAARPAPVVLTHDIDSPEGLRNLVDTFLPLEEAIGARSSNYIVPCGWTLDHGLLREIVQRGHEIGVHGYDHSNRTPFVDPAERRRRLTDGFAALEGYAPVGYRAPSLMRSEALMTDLADYYQYDTSIPTSGGPFPVFNNGCATARPFRIGRMLEIPITVRRDGSALFLGYSPEEIAGMWEENAVAVASARGVVVLLTHCEKRFSGNGPMVRTYERFLNFVSSSQMFGWSTAVRVACSALRA